MLRANQLPEPQNDRAPAECRVRAVKRGTARPNVGDYSGSRSGRTRRVRASCCSRRHASIRA